MSGPPVVVDIVLVANIERGIGKDQIHAAGRQAAEALNAVALLDSVCSELCFRFQLSVFLSRPHLVFRRSAIVVA